MIDCVKQVCQRAIMAAAAASRSQQEQEPAAVASVVAAASRAMPGIFMMVIKNCQAI